MDDTVRTKGEEELRGEEDADESSSGGRGKITAATGLVGYLWTNKMAAYVLVAMVLMNFAQQFDRRVRERGRQGQLAPVSYQQNTTLSDTDVFLSAVAIHRVGITLIYQ